MLVNETFKDLFNDKNFSQRYNKEQDLLSEDDRMTADKDSAKLLRWYYCLNHMSFEKLKLLAILGIISKRLEKAKPSKYKGCIIGEMHQVPHKSYKQANKILPETLPGQVVSVDQMDGGTADFIAQLKGKLTTQQFRYATIFLNNHSRLSYIYPQVSTSSKHTLRAK